MSSASVLSKGRALASLLLAAALIWSGVALTRVSESVNASHSSSHVDTQSLIEDGEWEVREDQPQDLGGRDGVSTSLFRQDNSESPLYFDAEEEYRVLTRYGNTSEIVLEDYLSQGVSGGNFSLQSCDSSRADYYDSADVETGSLVLGSNVLGHVHGTNTQTETVCTVRATGDGGSQDQEFRFYTVSDRTPSALLPGAITLEEARAGEVDIRLSLPGGSLGYVQIGWRKAGGQPSFALVHGATDGMVLTIPGLEPSASYEVRAYLMNAQAFDLYRESNTAAAGTLIQEGSPDAKWVSNLAGGGLGKSQSISIDTLPVPTPTPTPEPTRVPEATLAPTPRPTPDDDDDDDDDGVDTPLTDNDGVDTPLTDNDGVDTPLTDNDGVDTPLTDNDGVDTPLTDNNGIDTPTPTPLTPTPTPLTPDPLTPTPDTPTPPTPDTPTPPTPDTPTPPTPDTPTPPTPDTPTPPTPDTPTPPTPDTPTPPTPDTPTPPTPDTPTPPTPDTPTPPTPDTPTPPTPDTPDTPDTPETNSDDDDSDDDDS